MNHGVDNWLLDECLALWRDERTRGLGEAVVRVRAMQEIARGLSTNDLLALATSAANADFVLPRSVRQPASRGKAA